MVAIWNEPSRMKIFNFPLKISLNVIPYGPIDNKSALVQIMAWRWTGDKPVSEPMMAYFTYAYMPHSASLS